MTQSLRTYLQDPLLHTLYQRVRAAGPIRSISLDITHKCNLRCIGCYYFNEDMDRHYTEDDADLDAFIERELQRGTNFITIVGGEPSIALRRLRKLYRHFKLSVATNGVKRIPKEGLEELPIGIALWGDPETDKFLRGGGKIDIFSKALRHYKDDERAFWYFTVAPGQAHVIPEVVPRLLDNGNMVLFNYYSDLAGLGGPYDYRQGFDAVRDQIDRMIERYPGRILMTPYFNKVIATGKLFDMTWGYEVCTNVSTNLEMNAQRMQNGYPYNRHFRAYNADFKTTRRCCTGHQRDCASCFDTWEHFSWIMVHAKKHLRSFAHFTGWLTTVYLFYFINRLVDFQEGKQLLYRIHKHPAFASLVAPE